MSRHGEAAGTAAALLGADQFGVGAVAAPMLGVPGAGGDGMGVVITIGFVSALAVMLIVVRPSRLGVLDDPPSWWLRPTDLPVPG